MTRQEIHDEILRQADGILGDTDISQVLLAMGGISPEDVFKVTVAVNQLGGLEIQLHVNPDPVTYIDMKS